MQTYWHQTQVRKSIFEKPQDESESGRSPHSHLSRSNEQPHGEEIRRALTETQAHMKTEMQEYQ